MQVGVQLQGALPPPPSGVYLRSELSCRETLRPLAQPGGGHPLRLRVQLVDQPAQLVESLVGIHVDDGGVEEVAVAVLHLAGLFRHFLQLLGLLKEKTKRKEKKIQNSEILFVARCVNTAVKCCCGRSRRDCALRGRKKAEKKRISKVASGS